MNKKYFMSFLMLIIILLPFVDSLPGQPHYYYGNVIINNAPARDGLLVSAKVDNSDVEANTTKNGRYGYDLDFVVEDPLGNMEGKTLKFFVQGFDTGESAIFSFDNLSPTGTQTIVNLDLSGDLFCGDNLCGSSESCSSCATDCGACPSSSSSSSGGGGSGGGGGGSGSGGGGGGIAPQQLSTTINNASESSACVSDWICSDWLPCISASQKRVCVDANRCSIPTDKPELERECEIPKAIAEESLPQQLNAQPSRFSAATGAIISALAKPSGAIAAIVVIVLVLTALYAGYHHLYKKK